MNRKMLSVKLIAVILTVSGLLSCSQKNTLPVQDISLLPKVSEIKVNEEQLLIESPVSVYADTSVTHVIYAANYLENYLQDIYGIQVNIADNKKDAQIILSKNPDLENKESYHLLIDDKIRIEASEANGHFYGIQTLLQLLQPTKGKYSALTFPVVDITDTPEFKWRGMHLDVCRHFYSVETVKKLIDLMAIHKMNTFHWHLTDDQGWRIEIKKYPKLTEIGGWRNGTVIGHMANYPLEYDTIRYGGYYTQEEIRDVIDYANQRFVTIVPEIEMPGHARAALAAYPQYSCTRGPFEVWKEWGINSDVFCPGKDSTFTFMEDILKEVIDLFPGEYIHIGGDECLKDNWQTCNDCQLRIKNEGLKDEMELQSYFVKRIEKFIAENSKKLIGWDEIIEGGLPERAAVMSWRGTEGGIHAANTGHDAVMTPNPHLYFDHYQSSYYEPLAIAGLTTVEEVFNYDPIPDELDKDKIHHILGAQANHWTEYILTPEHLEYMVYPRLCALAERLWNYHSNDYADFNKRLTRHYRRLDLYDVNYRIDYPEGILPIQVYTTENIQIDLHSPVPGAKILYTLNGSEPDADSEILDSVLNIAFEEDTIVLKAKLMLPSGRTGNTFTSHLILNKNIVPSASEHSGSGAKYKLYDNVTGTARGIDSAKLVKTGTSTHFRIPSSAPSNFFGLDFNGYILIERSGIYTFSLTADDGAILFIGEQEIIDNDLYQYGSEKSGKIEFSEPGYYPLRLLYFNGKYGSNLELDYEGPGIDRKEIDQIFQ